MAEDSTIPDNDASSEPRNRRRVPFTALIALPLLVIAVIMVAIQILPEDGSEVVATTKLFKCVQCQGVVELSPAQMRGAFAAGSVRTGSTFKIRCPECGELSAQPAVQCPNDSTVFIGVSEAGESAHCPECGWSPIGELAELHKSADNDS